MVAHHIQRTRGALNQRDAAVAANGKSAADGDVVVVQVGYQHLLYAAILQVILDGSERAEDDAFDTLEVILQTQHIEQSVDVVQRLFHLFYKQDDIVLRSQVYFCSCYCRIARKVTTHKDALGMSAAVIGTTGYAVLWQRAEKDVTDDGSGGFLAAIWNAIGPWMHITPA